MVPFGDAALLSPSAAELDADAALTSALSFRPMVLSLRRSFRAVQCMKRAGAKARCATEEQRDDWKRPLSSPK
ncbi:hypothetical protein B0G81_3785 [Paraburkholderia sp. BL6665CI2N2]|nr:hypothetical protein B0G81_3785 [Paraburkholderia sp. BL6665CI2N2]